MEQACKKAVLKLEMMKKAGVYIGLIVVGLAAGYFLFGEPLAKGTENHEHTKAEDTQVWTCSMHPQIQKSEPGDCPICGMELVPQDTGSGEASENQFKMTKTAMALANVETTTVGETGIGESGFSLSGKIQVNEKTNTTQVAYFSGRIEQLYVNSTGEKIYYGQRLATVYSPDLVSAQQELLTAASSKQSNPGLYRAVRNKLKSWKLSDKQIDKIEESGETRDNFPIYATTSGTVSEKLVETGDYIEKGQPLFNIADLSTVWAVFDAYENQINQLKEGQKISIQSKAYPDKTVHGKITFIEPTLNTSTRTVKVRAVLANKNGQFKPGMFVKGELQERKVSASQKSLAVPKSAVLWTGKRSVVYVQPNPENPVFELRKVELGNETEDSYQILSGLTKGEEVVTNGAFTVDAAAQLQGKPSMMGP